MFEKSLTLAYSEQNQETALQVAGHLQAAGLDFNLLVSHQDLPEPSLAERLSRVEGNIIMLISESFLKSTNCLFSLLPFYNAHASRIFSVIIPEQGTDPETGEPTTILVKFERVADILKHISYWQNKHIDFRKQVRIMNTPDDEALNDRLRMIREVSSDIGELLRTIKSNVCMVWDSLLSEQYGPLFQFLDVNPPAGFSVSTIATAEPMPSGNSALDDMLSEIGGVKIPNEDESSAGEASPFPERGTAEPPPIPDIDFPAEMPENQIFESEDDTTITPLPASGWGEPDEPTPLPDAEPVETEEEPVQVWVDDDHEAEAAEPGEALPQVVEEQGVEEIIASAAMLAAQGRREEAMAKLNNALQEHPDSEPLRFHYALTLIQQYDDYAEAANQLNVLLQQHPQHPQALFLMGEICEINNDLIRAEQFFQTFTQVSPDYAEGWFRLGMVLLKISPDYAVRAKACFTNTLHHFPTHGEAYYQLALLLQGEGQTEEAAQLFHRTLELLPDHPFAWYDLALLYHRREDAEQAYHAYQRATVNNPELKTPQNDMAFEYHRAARSARATEIFEKEQSALAELRENINRLEALLKEREEEIDQLMGDKVRPELTVLITGATSGIGKASAMLLAEHGYRLILTGRRAERLQDLKIALETDFQAEVLSLQLDVRDAAAVEQAINNLPESWKVIDVLVNNAGKAKGLSSIHEGSLHHWDEMIDTNIKGLLYMTRAVSPQMVARKRGHIINVGSTAGKETYLNGNVYSATKFAVEALTKSMRIDLHTHNIRVSQVSPGHVEETEFALVRFDGDENRARIYDDFQPLRSSDVAETILFMINRPAHVNIQDILLMGTQQASSLYIDRSGRDA
jgi:NADP-dependent 3-hydroxy acid dehydrogenase YdfG/Flp pilus assembly protein TadD